MKKGMDKLFNPDSIAVIGASNSPHKVGNNILRNLRDCGFRGRLYPINLNEEIVLNMKAHKSVLDVPGPIELAVIAIPAQFTVRAIEECGKKKIPYAIIISAGFKEVGESDLQDNVLMAARANNVRVLGPNCLGIINLSNNMNASFSSINPKRGNISFISQSGALCSSILSLAVNENFGFSKFISVGNKVDLDECDLLEYLGNDADTEVILVYLESLKNGRRFMEVAKQVTKHKPVIMIKAGVTEAGARAVSSHTGAMAGIEGVFDAALRQSGVIRVCCLNDLFDAAELFSKIRTLENNNLLIVTNGGGMGVITVDTCMKKRIPLAQLSDENKAKISLLLPGNAQVGNPVDVIGDAPAERFRLVLEAAMKDNSVGIILVIVTPQSMTEIVETAELVIKLSGQKPIISNFIGREHRMLIAQELLNESSMPNFDFPEGAVNGIEMLTRYNSFLKKGVSELITPEFNRNEVMSVINGARAEGRKKLTLKEGFTILKAFGIKTPPQIFSNRIEDHLDFLKHHHSVVLKLDSAESQHKTDSKLLSGKISTENELLPEFERLKKKGEALGSYSICGQAHVLGVEVIAGGISDTTFGAVVTAGIGGVFTELLKDVSFRVPPLTDEDVEDMLWELKGKRILEGFRNTPRADRASIKQVIHAIGAMLLHVPEIAEIEVNPIIVSPETGFAVDVLVSLR